MKKTFSEKCFEVKMKIKFAKMTENHAFWPRIFLSVK